MCLKAANDNAAEIRRIAACDSITLRDAALRPGMPPGGSHYPGDDSPETLHLGAFSDNMLVAVATLCREAMPGTQSATSWRLRGMATLPVYRGRGLGTQLTQRCIAYAAEQGGTCVWCTSRVTTVAFYRTLGFTECSDTFSLPEFSVALYIRMQRPLP
jgi:ribosomal protein S18 acetylase RimI-like enzyme